MSACRLLRWGVDSTTMLIAVRLAAHHPDLLEKVLFLEHNALMGRYSRFDEVAFSASREELVRTADRFPSFSTTIGLGRSFAWNQLARTNGVDDETFRARRGRAVAAGSSPVPPNFSLRTMLAVAGLAVTGPRTTGR